MSDVPIENRPGGTLPLSDLWAIMGQTYAWILGIVLILMLLLLFTRKTRKRRASSLLLGLHRVEREVNLINFWDSEIELFRKEQKEQDDLDWFEDYVRRGELYQDFT